MSVHAGAPCQWRSEYCRVQNGETAGDSSHEIELAICKEGDAPPSLGSTAERRAVRVCTAAFSLCFFVFETLSWCVLRGGVLRLQGSCKTAFQEHNSRLPSRRSLQIPAAPSHLRCSHSRSSSCPASGKMPSLGSRLLPLAATAPRNRQRLLSPDLCRARNQHLPCNSSLRKTRLGYAS